jgi:hypothetical protein
MQFHHCQPGYRIMESMVRCSDLRNRQPLTITKSDPPMKSKGSIWKPILKSRANQQQDDTAGNDGVHDKETMRLMWARWDWKSRRWNDMREMEDEWFDQIMEMRRQDSHQQRQREVRDGIRCFGKTMLSLPRNEDGLDEAAQHSKVWMLNKKVIKVNHVINHRFASVLGQDFDIWIWPFQHS